MCLIPPRLTERGVKFFQRKVESFEEVSCRAGRGWMLERSEEERPLLRAAGFGAPFQSPRVSLRPVPASRPFFNPKGTQAFCLDIGGWNKGTVG